MVAREGFNDIAAFEQRTEDREGRIPAGRSRGQEKSQCQVLEVGKCHMH